MAENDYIGNIQNQRLNQQWSNNMAWSTPSWMRGGFKEGPRVSTQRFQATTSGAQLNWGQGDTTPRVHSFSASKKQGGQRDGAHGADNQWEENQQPTFLANLITKRANSRAQNRSGTQAGTP